MAGLYQEPLNRYAKYGPYLAHWIDRAIKDKVWERVDDLHIDVIDEQFTDRAYWVDASIELYGLILNLLKDEPYACYLGIALEPTDRKTNTNLLDLRYIKMQLHTTTPPSFYLFPYAKSDEQYFEGRPLVEKLSKEIGYKAFWGEEAEPDGIYYQFINIAGNSGTLKAARPVKKARAISVTENHYYFLWLLTDSLERQYKKLKEAHQQTPFSYSRIWRHKAGCLVAYEYLLGVLSGSALACGMLPYISTFGLAAEDIQKYHGQKSEPEVVRAYTRYLELVVARCREQYKIALAAGKQAKNQGMKSECLLWQGVQEEYDKISYWISELAILYEIPIHGFVSQKLIDSNITPPAGFWHFQDDELGG